MVKHVFKAGNPWCHAWKAPIKTTAYAPTNALLTEIDPNKLQWGMDFDIHKILPGLVKFCVKELSA